jgi:hypothetical protein
MLAQGQNHALQVSRSGAVSGWHSLMERSNLLQQRWDHLMENEELSSQLLSAWQSPTLRDILVHSFD